MLKWKRGQYRNAAIAAGAIGLLTIVALELLLSIELPLWAHIPLTGIALTLIGVGGLAAGISFAEYQGRSVASREQSH